MCIKRDHRQYNPYSEVKAIAHSSEDTKTCKYRSRIQILENLIGDGNQQIKPVIRSEMDKCDFVQDSGYKFLFLKAYVTCKYPLVGQ